MKPVSERAESVNVVIFKRWVMDEIYTKNSIPCNVTHPPTAPAVSCMEGVLFIPNLKRYDRLNQEDIRFVKGDKSHVTLYLTGNRKVSVSTHLGQFSRYLDTNWFVRTSRSYIVNLRYIVAITTRSVALSDQEIPLTDAYRTSLWSRLPIVRLKSD